MVAWMRDLAQIERKQEIRIIWVTSGAIVTGGRLRYRGPERRTTLRASQALSALGQPELMSSYLKALKKVKRLGAQVLLTADDIRHQKRCQLLKQTLEQLLEWRVVPILNENDAVATEEIEFGDNDQLAAQGAVLMKAKRLLLLSDVPGVVDAKGELVAKGKAAKLKKLIQGPGKGRGGMESKIRAAEYAMKHGVDAWIADGAQSGVLESWARGSQIGTAVLERTR